MIKHHFLIALRHFRKGKGFSIIIISGLIIGMAAFALIMQYVWYELSYDKFQGNSKDIYRIALTVKGKDKEAAGYATTFLPIAPLIKDEFPEVVDYNRILYLDRHAIVTYEDKIFQQENVVYADPSFFTFFDYPLLQGDPHTALREKNTVVISESLAKKYFGVKDPMGQWVKLNEEFNELNLLVTGIHKDIPENTHIKPKMIVSLRSVENLPATVENKWRWPIYLNYVRLQRGADPNLLEAKLAEFSAKYIVTQNKETQYSLFLQSLSSIHLTSHLEYEIEENASATMVYLMMLAASLILIIAYVNFINLATSKSLTRTREVGVRKILGGGTWQLIRQFFIEAGIFNVLSILLTLGIVLFVQRNLLQFIGIGSGFSSNDNSVLWIILTSCLLVGTVVSAFYPSAVLASIKPLSALKGLKSPTGLSGRKTLVVIQFAATIGLLINAYAIYIQIDLMRSKALGMDINQILVVNAPRVTEITNGMVSSNDHVDAFKTQSLNIRGIKKITASASIPGVWIAKARGIYRIGHNNEENTLVYQTLGIDFDFLSTYSLNFLAGRNFSDLYGTDSDAVVLTEQSMKQLGFSSPSDALNEHIKFGQHEKVIIGVVSDYHHMSLRENYQPIIFYPESDHKEYYSLRIQSEDENLPNILSSLEEQWKAIYPSNPFEYTFLNESFQEQYAADVTFGKVFNMFSVLAVLLTCMGLFGLASLTAYKRTKEIGIRKVLGSSTIQIMSLLLKDTAALLLGATALAVPIAYFTLSTWLNQFAFRICLSWWIFIVPPLSVGLIALLSISVQIIRTATANPVTALKHE